MNRNLFISETKRLEAQYPNFHDTPDMMYLYPDFKDGGYIKERPEVQSQSHEYRECNSYYTCLMSGILKPDEKLVLFGIMAIEATNRECYAGHEYLAKMTGLSLRKVQRAYKGLKEQKYILVKHRHNNSNITMTNHDHPDLLTPIKFKDILARELKRG